MDKNKKLIIIVAALAFIKLIIMPQISQQNDSLTDKKQLVVSNIKLASMLATVDEQKEQAEKLSSQLDKMQRLVPSYPSPSQAKLKIQQKIEQYAKELNVVIQSFNWQETIEDENIALLMRGKIQLDLQGSLLNIIKLQNALADNQPAITIESLTNSLSDKEGNITMKSKLNLVILFQQGQVDG
ncbi:hypothetical protein [Colwellia sp. RSH04]|uniref:hypothetical protein n=1 Tax=Colwellia sp. RSH04 TaxID=2305464 RepID=UPI000E58B4DB|nr:hypothetical protein [Colwellia sp. RSH04]RHW74874.1 hypothetical protein D1094_16490 [Colwellia sp. RSH04]